MKSEGEDGGCPGFMLAYIFRMVLKSNYVKFGSDLLKGSGVCLWGKIKSNKIIDLDESS